MQLPIRKPSVPQQSRIGDFRISIQSHSFAGIGFAEAAAIVAALGIQEFEVCPNYLPHGSDETAQADAKRILSDYGLVMKVHGVNAIPADKAEIRRFFEFARDWGIEILTAKPAIEALDYVEELAEEFGIRVAVHNNGPRNIYANTATLRACLKGRSRLLGICLDTEQFLYSPGEDSITMIGEFSDRLHSIHLSNTSFKQKESIIGQSQLDLLDFLTKLRDVEFAGPIALELMGRSENPQPELLEMLEQIKAAVLQL